VRDATIAGLHAVRAVYDPHAINAVVVLTDGVDNASTHGGSDVIEELERQAGNESSTQIRVFTIAYGRDPNAEELAKYAAASGGKSYTGRTTNIASVYLSISSFF
jgi:Ca-activated chloride channel homolog